MSRFFIDRPIFAWVIAIVIMLAGALAIRTLPIAQYPDHRAAGGVHRRQLSRRLGARRCENTVTQVIEQQLNGLDHLLYFSSTSELGRPGRRSPLTFAAGHQPRHRPGAGAEQAAAGDAAAAAGGAAAGHRRRQVAARASCWSSALYDTDGPLHRRRHRRLSSPATCSDPLSRVNGVGDVAGVRRASTPCASGSIPYKLEQLQADAGRRAATRSRRRTSRSPPARSAACRPSPGQQLERHRHRPVAPADARAVPQTSSSRASPTASVVRLRDVARVELGATELRRRQPPQRPARPPASPSSSRPAPTRSTTADAVKAKATELAASLPAGREAGLPGRHHPLRHALDPARWSRP